LDANLIAKAFCLGLIIAAPVGPMSLLLIARTLRSGVCAGLPFGAGIAAADFTYAAIAAFGVTVISNALLTHVRVIQIVGAAVMIALGIKIALSKVPQQSAPLRSTRGAGAFLTAYFLTLANPPTILFFLSVFASLSWQGSVLQALVFALAVCLGSLCWWVFWIAVIAKMAPRLGPDVMAWINRVSGLLLIAFAVYAVVGARSSA
jgi:threonine/homoserine/homoserine lactone efflux protein